MADEQKAWSDSRISKEEDQEDLLAYSKDRRFLLRRVSRDQAKVLASVLPAYHMVLLRLLLLRRRRLHLHG